VAGGEWRRVSVIPLETERLVIRDFVGDDWRDLHEMILLYQASEYAMYDHKWPTSEKEIRGVTEWFASGDRFRAVYLKETAKLIGFISLNLKEEGEGKVYGFGYVFHTGYQGQGYATEACRAVLDHAFEPLAADRITTGTAKANLPSVRLLKKLGLRVVQERVGTSWKEQDGKPIEVVTLSLTMTRDEWQAASGE